MAILFAISANAAIAVEPDVAIVDEFDGKLTLDWKPIRHDADWVSLTKNPGKLTITTQPGTLGYNEKLPGRIATRNLHFIANPIKKGGDFAITTCVDSFHPTQTWQQAGLMIYDDDDNYLKYDIEWGGQHVCFKHMRETDQFRIVDTDDEIPKAEKHWLRITKRGNVYERAYSTNGKDFTVAGEKSWGHRDPEWIGLVATNGTSRAPGIDAQFDFFEVRTLTKQEQDDPRYRERKAIKGKWEVKSCEFQGTLLEKNAFENFDFDGGYVSFAEINELGSTAYRLEYALDPTTSPKGFIMSAFQPNADTPLNGNYQLNDDELLLCLSFVPGSPAPDEFKTTEGDRRMLIKMKRTSDQEK
ncbi:DUF1349 domain-containing protein [Stieleria marina]|uniref:beta-xylosidase family glycoside hydrolase n=1 Tax=Stieleria marina TaxID=1930275 RepID=UPI003AF3B74D